ncbi:uncharacterized protein LOC133925786 [Phragmites australis]|uniref:uncharacterized protein LOC133925786 n=1 Tax=Phragmites australis TaxID=29695 RepID=UPI002D79CBD3|nr:uncharacterized protein LOC133925786 [Phragmites australis]
MAPPAAGLNEKHYILAALAATVVAAAVVTVVFVVLSPARVHFSVTNAGSHLSDDGTVQLNFTLAANNPSRRAEVMYRSMFVDVSNSTGLLWVNWVRAYVATAIPLQQPTDNVTTIAASVTLLGDPSTEAFTGNMKSEFTVKVTAMARFKVGVARTRLYDIKVYCRPVNFFSASQSSAAGSPVRCHAA